MSDHPESTVRSTIVVDAPVDVAFDVFTADMGSWWPPEHHILGEQLAEMVFEPRQGGHVYDRGVSGAEGPRRTRVELEHRHIDRHGDGWQQMRGALRSPEGWEDGLRRFAARIEAVRGAVL